MRSAIKWAIFGFLCIVSWICAGLFLLTTGWASCSVTGWCIT